MNQYNVFSGVFADEMSQRFLKIMQHAFDSAFTDLYVSSMPQHPKRFKQCLDRVCTWEASVIRDEIEQLRRAYPDVNECFKHVYVTYVKAMRGGARMKLMVNMPRLDEFLMRYYTTISKHRCVQDARYFQNCSLLDQRVTCLDAARDSLFEFLGEEHVKLEDKSVISEASSSYRPQREERNVASKVAPDGIKDCASEVSRHSSRREDSSSKVVSNVVSNVLTENRTPNTIDEEDDESVLGPDDSVSNVDFATKQHAGIQKYLERQRLENRNRSNEDQSNSQEEAHEESGIEPIAEDDENGSEHSSRTSVSLSSISISQSGTRPRRADARSTASRRSCDRSDVSKRSDTSRLSRRNDRNDAREFGNANAPFDRLSEASMQQQDETRDANTRSPIRSYVTHLTEDDDD